MTPMVIRPDWRHFWSPLAKRLNRGARAILVVVFVTLVWFLLRFEVVRYADSPPIELLMLILGLLLVLTWLLVLLLGFLVALVSTRLLVERLESHEGVVVHRGLFRVPKRVAIVEGTRLRCSILRLGRLVDVLESTDRKTAVVVSRRVFGDRLDLFWASAGIEPEPPEVVP